MRIDVGLGCCPSVCVLQSRPHQPIFNCVFRTPRARRCGHWGSAIGLPWSASHSPTQQFPAFYFGTGEQVSERAICESVIAGHWWHGRWALRHRRRGGRRGKDERTSSYYMCMSLKQGKVVQRAVLAGREGSVGSCRDSQNTRQRVTPCQQSQGDKRARGGIGLSIMCGPGNADREVQSVAHGRAWSVRPQLPTGTTLEAGIRVSRPREGCLCDPMMGAAGCWSPCSQRRRGRPVGRPGRLGMGGSG